MKKRLFAFLLVICMVMGLLPATALADTSKTGSVELNADNNSVTIDGTAYTLYLAQGTQRQNGTLGFWLDPVNRGFVPGAADPVNDFRYYLFLLDSSKAEASQVVYEKFWTECVIGDAAISVDGQSNTNGVELGEVGTYTDGYHKYIPVSVTGAKGGEVSVVIQNSDGVRCTLYKKFQYTQATELTSDTDSYTFSVEARKSGFYYIDLGSAKTVTVSGALDGAAAVGRIALAQTAEGTDESLVWWRFQNGAAASTANRTAVTDKILLRAQNTGSEAVTGTVTVEVEQPKLMCRYMSYNGSAWTEDSRFYDLSAVMLGIGQWRGMRLYYGTASDALCLTGGTFETNASEVAYIRENDASAPSADGNPFYYVCSSGKLGCAQMTYTSADNAEYTFRVNVTLPYYGFYSQEERSEANYLSTVTLTGDETDPAVWFISENSMESIKENIVVKVGDTDITSNCIWAVDNCKLKIILPTNITSGSYEVAVYNGASKMRGLQVILQSGYAAYVGDYVIGFAEKRADGEITKICETATNVFGHGTHEAVSPDTVPYRELIKINIAAATKSQDTTGATIYEVAPMVTESLVIKRLWIKYISGDNTTFSWSDSGLVTELTSVENGSVSLYERGGRNCEATICAEIAVTIDGQTYEKTVRTNIGLALIEGGTLTRPDSDTTEQLNAFLKELAGSLNTADQINELYHIKLGDTSYEGTIEVPAEFVRGYACLHFVGATGADRETVINGSLDINGANIEYIQDIHFIADETSAEQTRAIFGGGLRNVRNCSFYGYDIALDSDEGLINASESVFVNNEIAAMIKVDASMSDDNVLPGDWNNNTFINNGTAVQIFSLGKAVSPYYFRIYDSNFINNGTDIDAQCGGTLYMYRNYFGRYKEVDGHRPTPGKYHPDRRNGRDDLHLDELKDARTLTSLGDILDLEVDLISAKVSTANNTKVITNPRWKYPVKGWWGRNILINDVFFLADQVVPEAALMTLSVEEEYEDILISDWSVETTILNEEADGLQLDASAFDIATGTDKTIEVLDEQEQTLGTWTFPEVSIFSLRAVSSDTTGSFHAGVEVDRTVEGQVSVTVQSSDVLANKTPILSIPCETQAAVTFNGVEIDSVCKDGQIVFRVAAGGTYIITLEVTAKYNSDAGTVTLSGVCAGTNTVLAVYCSGQMVYTDMQVSQAAGAPIVFELPESLTADTIRVFLLTADWMPVEEDKNWAK